MDIKSAQTKFAAVAYFNICVLWGASNLFVKIGAGAIPPMQFAALRFLLAGAILSSIAVIRRDRFSFSGRELMSLVKMGVMLNFLTNGCVVISNTMIDSSVVTLMMATTPIFATVFEVMAGGTRVGYKVLIGLAGGFIGIAVVVFSGIGAVQANVQGIAVILLGVFFWTAGTLYSKKRAIPGSVFWQTAVEVLSASVLFFLTSNVTGAVPLHDLTLKGLIPVFYLAVFDSVIGFASYIYLLRVVPASVVCTYAYINPVVALILGYLFLDEQLAPGKILGMVVIIGSVIFMEKSRAGQSAH